MSEIIDLVEILGPEVESGQTSRDEAIDMIVEASGLDDVSAADWLDHWKTAVAACGRLYAESADRLIALAFAQMPGGGS